MFLNLDINHRQQRKISRLPLLSANISLKNEIPNFYIIFADIFIKERLLCKVDACFSYENNTGFLK